MQTDQTQPVSLRELAATLFIYKCTILALALAFGIAATVFSWIQPMIYQSSVQIWAQDQSPGLRGTSQYATDSAARVKMVLSNVYEVVYSRQVLESTMERCGVLNPASSEDPVAAQSARDELVSKLGKAIRLEAPKGSDFGTTQIFFIRLKDPDPDRAQALLTALLDSFRQRYEQLSAEQAQHLYRDTTTQVEKSREQLAVAVTAFDEFVRQLEGGMGELNSMGGAPGGDSELRRALATINDRLLPAETDLKLQQALLMQFERLEMDRTPLVDVPASLIRDYPALEQSIRELTGARVQLSSVAARVTIENPEYQTALERLRLLESVFLDEVKRAASAVRKEIAAKTEAVDFMRTEKEQYLARVAELTNRFVEFDGLRQEMTQRRAIVVDAEKRRSDAAHALATAAQETLFATIDGPRTSTKPVSPNRRLNVLIGTLLGLVTGVGLAFLTRQFSLVVRSETDLVDITSGLIVVSVPRVKRPLHKAG